jgi:hypothetical protein
VEVIRRTFEAATHPKGSEERARLNERAETSEYFPAMRYMTSGDRKSFRTKALALAHIDAGPWCATCGGHWCSHGEDTGHPFVAA